MQQHFQEKTAKEIIYCQRNNRWKCFKALELIFCSLAAHTKDSYEARKLCENCKLFYVWKSSTSTLTSQLSNFLEMAIKRRLKNIRQKHPTQTAEEGVMSSTTVSLLEDLSSYRQNDG